MKDFNGLTLEKLRQIKKKLGSPDTEGPLIVNANTPQDIEILRHFKREQTRKEDQ